jgi:hypothetical protein
MGTEPKRVKMTVDDVEFLEISRHQIRPKMKAVEMEMAEIFI